MRRLMRSDKLKKWFHDTAGCAMGKRRGTRSNYAIFWVSGEVEKYVPLVEGVSILGDCSSDHVPTHGAML